MHRLFVALRPSLSTRRVLLAAMGGVPGARWQDDTQLHLTLRFLGELDRHRAEDVAGALGAIRGAPVPVRIEGTGAFDRRDRIHTLWAAVRPDPALARLQATVERAVARAGLPPQTRTFHPHVTLARLAAGRDLVVPWLARTATLTTPMEILDAVLLMESVLGRDGASYHPVARYPLNA